MFALANTARPDLGSCIAMTSDCNAVNVPRPQLVPHLWQASTELLPLDPAKQLGTDGEPS